MPIQHQEPTVRPTGGLRRANANLLAAARRRRGLGGAEPLDTQTAFALLLELGYMPTRNRLEHYLQRGFLAPPPKISDRFAWGDKSLLDFAACLELKRAWLPFHTRHQHKKTDDERRREFEKHARDIEIALKLEEHTTTELIHMIVACQTDDLRRSIAAALLGRVAETNA